MKRFIVVGLWGLSVAGSCMAHEGWYAGLSLGHANAKHDELDAMVSRNRENNPSLTSSISTKYGAVKLRLYTIPWPGNRRGRLGRDHTHKP